MPKNNNDDIVIKLKLGSKEFLEEFDDIEKLVNRSLSNAVNVGIDKASLKQLEELKDALEDVKSDITNIKQNKIGRTAFDTFAKKTNEKIELIHTKIDALQDVLATTIAQMGELGTNVDLSKAVGQFDKLSDTIKSCNAAIDEIAKNKKIKGDILVDLNGVDKIEEAVNKLQSAIKKTEDLSYKDVGMFDDLEDDKLLPKMEEFVKQYVKLRKAQKEANDAYRSAPKDDNILESANLQRVNLEVTQIAKKMELLKDAMYERTGQETSWGDLATDIALAQTSAENATKTFEEAQNQLNAILSKAQTIAEGYNDSIQQASKELGQLDDKVGSIQKLADLLKDNAIYIDIEPRKDDLSEKLNDAVREIQQELNKKSLTIPIKLVISSAPKSAADSPEDAAIKTAESTIKKAQQSKDSVFIDMSKTVGKSFSDALVTATSMANKAFGEIRRTVEAIFKTPIPVEFEPQKDSLKNFKQEIQSAVAGGEFDITDDLKSASDAANLLKESLAEVLGLASDLKAKSKLNTDYTGKETKATLQQKVKQYQNDIEAILSAVQKEIVDQKPVWIKLDIQQSEFGKIKGKIEENLKPENLDITSSLKEADEIANQIAKTLGVLNGFQTTITGVSNAVDLTETNAQIEQAVGQLRAIMEYLDAIRTSIQGIQTNNVADELKEDTKDIRVDFSDIIDKINELMTVSKALIEDLRLDFSVAESSIRELGTTLSNVIAEASNNNLDSKWLNIAEAFRSIAGEADNIDLRKQKNQIQELLAQYQEYVSLGGRYSFDMLTNNQKTLEKLQKVSNQSFNALPVSSNKSVEEVYDSFEKILVSLNSIDGRLVEILGKVDGIQLSPDQIEGFQKLDNILKRIVDSLDTINGKGKKKYQIALSKEDAASFESLSQSLAEISGLKDVKDVFSCIKITPKNLENISNLATVLPQIANGLKELDTNHTIGFLNQISELAKASEGLERLATVLSATKKQIAEATNPTLASTIVPKNVSSGIEEVEKLINRYENVFKGQKAENFKKIKDETEEIIANMRAMGEISLSSSSAADIQRFNELAEKLELSKSKLQSLEQLAKDSSITKMVLKITKFLDQAKNLTDEEIAALKDLIARARDANVTKAQLEEIGAEFHTIETNAISAGHVAGNFFDAVKNKLKYKWAETFAMFFSFYDIIRYVRELSSAVKELNDAMIELSKVSDTSISELYKQFDDFRKIAMETGNSIKGVISATADWARMGYSLPDSKKLAEVAQIYKNVGDNISIDEANEYLISTLQGFQKTADEALHIVDIYNEVANNFAIDTQGIGEAMERSAASFYAANTSLEESVALVTTANTVLQNPEMVGTTFKTLSARIRGATTELEDMGEEATITTSKLRDTIKALTGFDILKEDNETFKSIYEILIGIGKEWENLTDIERASLGEMLAGKRNSNALYAVLQNIDTLEAAYQTAQESAGSAMREQEHYMEGISYSVEQFKVALEDISNDVLDSKFAKSVVDFGTKVLEFLDKIIEHPTIALLLGGGLALRKLSGNGNGGFIGLYGALHDVTTAYKEYIAAVIQAEQVQTMHTATTQAETVATEENAIANESEAYSEMQQAQADVAHSAAMKENIALSQAETASDIATASANVTEATTELAQKLKASFSSLLAMPGKILKGFKALVTAIPALGIGAAIAAIGLVAYKVYKDVEEGEEQLKKSAKEVGAEYQNTTRDIASYKKEIQELQDVINDSSSSYTQTSNARERLLTIQDELIDKYGTERAAIDNITEAINGQVNALDKLSDKQWRAAKRKFEENNLPGWDFLTHKIHGTDSDIGVMLDEMENAYASFRFNGLTNLNDRKLANMVKEIFGGQLLTSDMSVQGKASFTGSLDEVYNKLLLIQKKANEIGASDYALDSIEDAISKVEETMDSYKDFYNQYILQERIVGTDFEDNYQGYIKAFQKYQEAIVSGSEEKTQEALDLLANQYSGLVQELFADESLSDAERQSILSFFESLYPQLSAMISQWKFSADVEFKVNTKDLISGETVQKSQQDIVDDVVKNFKTREDLLHYNEKAATDEQKQAYSDLNALLAQRNATETDFINYLVQEGYYVQAIEKEISSVPSFSINFNQESVEKATDGIKELQSTYQTLYDKMKDGKEGIDLAFLMSDIDALQDKLKDADGNLAVSQSTWQDFFRTMTDGASSFEQMEEALNKVLTEYVNNTIAIENFDESQAQAISTQLQLAGVTKESADAYVQGMTAAANAIQDATDRGYDFVNATWNEIDAEFKLADQSRVTASEILAYALEKKASNGYTIKTAADVDNLLTLANAAGIAAKSLVRYAEIKADLDAAIKSGDTQKVKWVRQTLDTYIKQMDTAALAAEVRVSAATDKLEQDREKAAANHKSSSSKAAKQEEDLWKKAYEKELADLDHLHAMELISDIAYYEEKNRLNEKYFANNEKYTDDYRKNQEDIYKGLKAAYKTYLDDCLSYYAKTLEAGTMKLTEYSAQAKGLLENMLSNGLIDAATYHEKMADVYGNIIKRYDMAINAAQRTIKKEIDALNKEKKALNKDYDKRKEAIQAQIDQVQALIDARNDEIDSINDVIDSKNKQIKELNKEIKAKNKQIDAVNKEIKAKNKQIDELNDQVKAKNKEIDAINKEVKAKNKIIDGINKEIKARNKIIDGYQKQIDIIQDQIDIYQDEIDKLNEANKERQAALDMEKALYELNRAENQRSKMVYNSEKGFVYTANDEDIKNAQEQIENLKHEQAVAVLEKQISTLEDSIEVLNDKIENVRDEIEELNNKIEELQDEIEALNGKIENLQDEIEILNEKIENIQDEINNLNKIIEAWQEEIDAIDERIESLEEEIEVLDEHIEVLESEIEDLDDVIDGFEDKIDELEKELDGLVNKIDVQIEKYEEMSTAWGNVASKYTEGQEDMVAAELWGANYRQSILSGEQQFIDNFTNQYIQYQKLQADEQAKYTQSKIDNINREIDAIRALKAAQEAAAAAAVQNSSSSASTPAAASSTNIIYPSSAPSIVSAASKSTYIAASQQKRDNPTKSSAVHTNSANRRISGHTYGIGTHSADWGVHEVAETGDEIIRDNYGNAFLAKGHQLHQFEGGERVFSPTETQELLRGKYIPIEDILPNYADMASKLVGATLTSTLPSANIMKGRKTEAPSNEKSIAITIGDINVTEVDNAQQLAKAITNQLPTALLQELNRK